LIAMIAVTFLLVVWAVALKAPLEQPATSAKAPNPSKAPWYFLGLQELLERFPPVMAGVAFPTFVVIGMMLTPYIDKNPSRRPQDRKVAIFLMTVYIMLAVAFVVIGVFFRGVAFTWQWNRLLGHPGLHAPV
jgi:quinol-cytochrome oxidoreductase complex cytochrome b subunit